MFTNDITFGLKICIEAINILFSLELAYFIFINRNRRSKDFPLNIKAANVSSKISIGLSLFFFSFNIGLISYILQIRTWYYSDLLVLPEKFNGELFNNFFRFFVLIAFSALFLLNSDLFGKLIYRNIVISTQIILFISLYLSNFTGLIIVCLLFPLAAIHFKILWNLGQITRDRLHFQFKLLFVGFLFLFFGTIVSINLFDPTNFFLESIIPDLLYLIGILLIGLSYLSIPSICDAFAISFVDGLYITKNNGEILISHQFNKAILS